MEFNNTPSTSQITPLIIFPTPPFCAVSLLYFTSLLYFQHLFCMAFQMLRCSLNIFLCKDSADHCDTTDARSGKFCHMVRCHPTNGNDRDIHGFADCLYRLMAYFHRISFGARWEDLSHTNVVCSV